MIDTMQDFPWNPSEISGYNLPGSRYESDSDLLWIVGISLPVHWIMCGNNCVANTIVRQSFKYEIADRPVAFVGGPLIDDKHLHASALSFSEKRRINTALACVTSAPRTKMRYIEPTMTAAAGSLIKRCTFHLSKIGGDSQLYGGRGVLSLAPVLYLLLIAIGIGRVVSKNGWLLFSILVLLIGFAGVALSETRSTWGAAAVLALSAIVFVRKRLKVALVFGLIAFLGMAMAAMLQYDVFGRFGDTSGETTIAVKESFFAKYGRGAEYGLVAGAYRQEPYFLLSGRGVGALHFSHRGTSEAIGYWHSEYLGWLDRNGLFGLLVFLIMMYAGFSMSLRISRNTSGLMQFYGVTSFLLIMALLAEGVFHPILSHTRAASIFVCFLVIMANWAELNYSIEAEQPVLEYEEGYVMPFENVG